MFNVAFLFFNSESFGECPQAGQILCKFFFSKCITITEIRIWNFTLNHIKIWNNAFVIGIVISPYTTGGKYCET